jgi:alternate signal-mediated exported protein
MNKLLVGSLAGAAGFALLLGGAGTFALWNDNATANLGEVTTGSLTLDSDAPGVWSAGTPSLWVPGDSATYTESYTIAGNGDGLQAVLTGNYSQIAESGVSAEFTFVVEDKAGNVVAANPSVTSTAASNSYNFTPELSPYKAVATVNVRFDATGKVTQKKSISLGTVQINLQQTAATLG